LDKEDTGDPNDYARAQSDTNPETFGDVSR